MKRRHGMLLGLCLIALTAGALSRLQAEVPADPLPVPVERKAEPDTSGVYRLLARFNPAMADQLTDEVYLAAERFDLVPEILAGLIVTESSARPEARNKGCLGLGQVSWRVWAKDLRAGGIALKPVDLHDVRRGLAASAFVLRHYLDRHGTIRRALRCYSGGAGKWYADRVLGYASEAGL